MYRLLDLQDVTRLCIPMHSETTDRINHQETEPTIFNLSPGDMKMPTTAQPT